MKTLPRTTILCCVALLLSSWHACAITITNGSFEVPGFTNVDDCMQFEDSYQIEGWRLTMTEPSSIAEWVKAPSFAVDEGAYAVRLGNYGRLRTTINTIQGQRYHVLIRAAGGISPSILMAVVANRAFSANVATNSAFSNYEFDFIPYAGTPLDGDDIEILAEGGPITIDNLTVTPPPILLTVQVSQVQICWNTETNKLYQVEYRYGSASTWEHLGSPIQGNGSNHCVWDSAADQPTKFYRVHEAE